MKICSTCGATYTDRIDFCFEDGAVLGVQARGSATPLVQPDPPPAADPADAFDAPLPPPRLVRAQEEEALPAQAEQTPPPADPVTGPSGDDAPPVRKRRSLLPGAAPAAPPPTAPSAATPAPAAPAPAAPLATITPPQPEVAEVEYEEEVPTPEPRSAPKPPDPNRPLSPSHPGSNDPPWIEPAGSDATAGASPSTGPSRPASPAADLARSSSGRATSVPPAPAEEEEPARGRPAWLIPVAVLGVIALVGGGFFAVAALGLGGAALTSASHEGEEPAPVRPTVVPVPTAPGTDASVEPAAGDTDVAAILDSDAPAVDAPAEEGAAEGTAEPSAPTAPVSSPSVASPAPAGSGGSGSVVGAGSSTSAAAAASPPPAAAQIGKVTFDSSPAGASVSVGGVKKGVTPLTIDLPYGDHQVKLELAGHASVEKSVKVGASEVKVPSVALEAEIKIGKVFVALPGRDGQTLYVDGRKIGPLPQSIDLTEGTHAFAVEAPDGTRIEVSRDVAFTDGRAFINL